MKCLVSVLGMMLSVLLLGCSEPVPAGTREQPQLSPQAEQTAVNLGQTLPISAQATMAGQVIQLEVARTPQQQALGLMYRKSLEANRGMLFPFPTPRPASFWMKNVVINLDMIFLRDGKIVAIAPNVPPCTAEPCPTYGPSTPVDQVIELRGGRAAELGLNVGDRIKVQYLDTKKDAPVKSP